jgi:hypothetical protein
LWQHLIKTMQGSNHFYFCFCLFFDISNFLFSIRFTSPPPVLAGDCLFARPLRAAVYWSVRSQKNPDVLYNRVLNSFKSKLPFRLYIKCSCKQRVAYLRLTGYM